MNIFGLGKNSMAAVVHVATGNLPAARASLIKAGISCIPVVGYLPVGKLIDGTVTEEL
jgi:hypothetical protein